MDHCSVRVMERVNVLEGPQLLSLVEMSYVVLCCVVWDKPHLVTSIAESHYCVIFVYLSELRGWWSFV